MRRSIFSTVGRHRFPPLFSPSCSITGELTGLPGLTSRFWVAGLGWDKSHPSLTTSPSYLDSATFLEAQSLRCPPCTCRHLRVCASFHSVLMGPCLSHLRAGPRVCPGWSLNGSSHWWKVTHLSVSISSPTFLFLRKNPSRGAFLCSLSTLLYLSSVI